MGKYKISGFPAQDSERVAKTFEKLNIWHELKRNGSLWVSDSHYEKYSALNRRFENLARSVGVSFDNLKVFDHPRYYLRNDKSVVAFQNPYGMSFFEDPNWKMLIEHAHEFGLKITRLPAEDWLYSPGCLTYMIEEID